MDASAGAARSVDAGRAEGDAFPLVVEKGEDLHQLTCMISPPPGTMEMAEQ